MDTNLCPLLYEISCTALTLFMLNAAWLGWLGAALNIGRVVQRLHTSLNEQVGWRHVCCDASFCLYFIISTPLFINPFAHHCPQTQRYAIIVTSYRSVRK